MDLSRLIKKELKHIKVKHYDNYNLSNEENFVILSKQFGDIAYHLREKHFENLGKELIQLIGTAQFWLEILINKSLINKKELRKILNKYYKEE